MGGRGRDARRRSGRRELSVAVLPGRFELRASVGGWIGGRASPMWANTDLWRTSEQLETGPSARVAIGSHCCLAQNLTTRNGGIDAPVDLRDRSLSEAFGGVETYFDAVVRLPAWSVATFPSEVNCRRHRLNCHGYWGRWSGPMVTGRRSRRRCTNATSRMLRRTITTIARRRTTRN